MIRREFITLLGGAAAWPLAANAQPSVRVWRIGIFMNLASDDAEGQSRNAAFLQGLQELGWPSAVTCGSTIAGAPVIPIPTACAKTQRSYWHSRQTSSWPRRRR